MLMPSASAEDQQAASSPPSRRRDRPAILSLRSQLALRNTLQPLNRVQMKKQITFRFPIDNLRNRADHGRSQNHSISLHHPDSRRLVGYYCQTAFIAEIPVYHG